MGDCTKLITSELYSKMLRQGAARLGANRKVINDLNVFPIPDGDTGDNMHMTISGGLGTPGTEALGVFALQASKGMLLGARGNSGVILSRFFAGLAKGLDGIVEATQEQMVRAFAEGVKSAYGAVSNPVEGTMLTVLREGVANASGDSFEGWMERLIDAMKASLEHTPELLPVLKEAGVVDSGGAGVLCIAEGMLDALRGNVVPGPDADDHTDNTPGAHQPVDLDNFGPDSELTYGYCTEFLLRLQRSKVGDPDSFDPAPIKEFLESAGDSVVCFKDGSMVKAHVHTRTPGEILNKAQSWGEFLTIKIENMTLQHSGVTIQDKFLKKRKRYAVVAVASGEGLVNAFREAGVDEVIEGGQTMNPSAEDFVKAFDKADAEIVFVFPNNSNIILAAEQAASLYKSSEVIVLPSKTIGAGYVAAASIDRSCPDKEEIRQGAIETMASVSTGMVSRATRDALMDGVVVKAGDYIGFEHGRIVCCSTDRSETALRTAEALGIGLHDVALVFHGGDVPSEEAGQFANTLKEKYPRTEIMLTDGGQPVYDYIIVLC